jgi:hypothetical protein
MLLPLIEKDFHSINVEGLCSEALTGEFENSFDLFLRHTGKPIEELADGCAVFDVLEKRLDWNPRAAKNPRAADLARHPFNG